MAHTLPPLPYAARCARTAHRQADDGDSSRQASSGLRQQPECGAREASRPAVEERRGSDQAPQRGARGHPDGGAKQRRRPREPHDVLADHGAERRRRADRRDRRRDQLVVRQLRRVQGAVRQGRRRPLRQRLGVGHRHRRQARDREHAEPGQPDDGRQEAGLRHRRLGARVLPEVSEPPSRLHRRLVERGQLGGNQQAARRSNGAASRPGRAGKAGRAVTAHSPYPAHPALPAPSSPPALPWFCSSFSLTSPSASSFRSRLSDAKRA